MSTTTPSNDMTIDEALQKVNEKYDTKISESNSEIQGMIDDHDKLINSQIANLETWKTNQTNLQNEQTDFTIEQIKEQKEQAEKDYIKEQSGAYKDWQKQSDKYGVNAEQMAASGMTNTGFSESSQVAMYNQYQSRVTTARDAFERSVTAYDNMINEAKLQNNSILAEIAYNTLVAQNELALTGLNYEHSLILEKAQRKLELESMRNEEWYEILAQMNAESDDSTSEDDKDDEDNDDKDDGGSTTFDKPSDDYGTGEDTDNSEPTVDMESIIALDRGMMNEETLADLVATGQVTMRQLGDKLVFSNTSYEPGQSVLGKYTWLNTSKREKNTLGGSNPNKVKFKSQMK
ncbi:MAG: hypothetical protein IJ404_05715 [Clostridia bacterium]|nr:hypothetical protein [Clostridia bacterium]